MGPRTDAVGSDRSLLNGHPLASGDTFRPSLRGPCFSPADEARLGGPPACFVCWTLPGGVIFSGLDLREQLVLSEQTSTRSSPYHAAMSPARSGPR